MSYASPRREHVARSAGAHGRGTPRPTRGTIACDITMSPGPPLHEQGEVDSVAVRRSSLTGARQYDDVDINLPTRTLPGLSGELLTRGDSSADGSGMALTRMIRNGNADIADASRVADVRWRATRSPPPPSSSASDGNMGVVLSEVARRLSDASLSPTRRGGSVPPSWLPHDESSTSAMRTTRQGSGRSVVASANRGAWSTADQHGEHPQSTTTTTTKITVRRHSHTGGGGVGGGGGGSSGGGKWPLYDRTMLSPTESPSAVASDVESASHATATSTPSSGCGSPIQLDYPASSRPRRASLAKGSLLGDGSVSANGVSNFAASYFALRESFVVTSLGNQQFQHSDRPQSVRGVRQQPHQTLPFDYDLRNHNVGTGNAERPPKGRSATSSVMRGSGLFALPRVDRPGARQ